MATIPEENLGSPHTAQIIPLFPKPDSLDALKGKGFEPQDVVSRESKVGISRVLPAKSSDISIDDLMIEHLNHLLDFQRIWNEIAISNGRNKLVFAPMPEFDKLIRNLAGGDHVVRDFVFDLMHGNIPDAGYAKFEDKLEYIQQVLMALEDHVWDGLTLEGLESLDPAIALHVGFEAETQWGKTIFMVMLYILATSRLESRGRTDETIFIINVNRCNPAVQTQVDYDTALSIYNHLEFADSSRAGFTIGNLGAMHRNRFTGRLRNPQIMFKKNTAGQGQFEGMIAEIKETIKSARGTNLKKMTLLIDEGDEASSESSVFADMVDYAREHGILLRLVLITATSYPFKHLSRVKSVQVKFGPDTAYSGTVQGKLTPIWSATTATAELGVDITGFRPGIYGSAARFNKIKAVALGAKGKAHEAVLRTMSLRQQGIIRDKDFKTYRNECVNQLLELALVLKGGRDATETIEPTGQITFKELAYTALADAGRPMTSAEIWSHAEAMGLMARLGGNAATPRNTLSALLSREAKKPSLFKMTKSAGSSYYSVMTTGQYKLPMAKPFNGGKGAMWRLGTKSQADDIAKKLKQPLEKAGIKLILFYHGSPFNGIPKIKNDRRSALSVAIQEALDEGYEHYIVIMTGAGRRADRFPPHTTIFVDFTETFSTMTAMEQGTLGRASGFCKITDYQQTLVIVTDRNEALVRRFRFLFKKLRVKVPLKAVGSNAVRVDTVGDFDDSLRWNIDFSESIYANDPLLVRVRRDLERMIRPCIKNGERIQLVRKMSFEAAKSKGAMVSTDDTLFFPIYNILNSAVLAEMEHRFSRDEESMVALSDLMLASPFRAPPTDGKDRGFCLIEGGKGRVAITVGNRLTRDRDRPSQYFVAAAASPESRREEAQNDFLALVDNWFSERLDHTNAKTPQMISKAGKRVAPFLQFAEQLQLFDHIDLHLLDSKNGATTARAGDSVYDANTKLTLNWDAEKGECQFNFRQLEAKGGYRNSGATGRGLGDKDGEEYVPHVELQINIRHDGSRWRVEEVGLPLKPMGAKLRAFQSSEKHKDHVRPEFLFEHTKGGLRLMAMSLPLAEEATFFSAKTNVGLEDFVSALPGRKSAFHRLRTDADQDNYDRVSERMK